MVAIGGEEAVCGQVGCQGQMVNNSRTKKPGQAREAQKKSKAGRGRMEKGHGESHLGVMKKVEKNQTRPEGAEKHKQHCAEGKRPPSVLSSQQTPELKCTY